mgnify:CR=1 FL=1
MLTSKSIVIDQKLYEVVRYGIELPLTSLYYFNTINKQAYDNLPADLQKIMTAAGESERQFAMPELKAGFYKGEKEKFEKLVTAKTITMTTLSEADVAKMRANAAPVWELYGQRYGAVSQKIIKGVREILKR